jgi:Spy/CpxP family protein refolding chaperone
MKTKFLIPAICFFSLTAMAQQPQAPQPQPPPHEHGERAQERKENIESMKIGFITQKLDLTPTEAQVFWPVYNQYSDKMDELRKKRREDKREAKRNFDELSDKEVEQEVDNEIIFRQKELDIQKEYHAKFKSVLSIKKVAKLYAAEEEFKMVLLNKLKDRERDRKPGKN